MYEYTFIIILILIYNITIYKYNQIIIIYNAYDYYDLIFY